MLLFNKFVSEKNDLLYDLKVGRSDKNTKKEMMKINLGIISLSLV